MLPRLLIFAAIVLAWAGVARAAEDPLAWPAITSESRPWTRWWWLGSAVDKPNLTRLLTEYRDAGIGGVEICPIYGARGYEARYLEFLSPKWMQMLAHTTAEARRLGIGVDFTTGTGWPFGGPNVSADHASGKVVLKRYDLAGGASLNEPLLAGQLQCLRAVSDDGQQLDLAEHVRDGKLQWTIPPGHWRVYAVAEVSAIQKVKRAAPGGEGNVLDPYSAEAMASYLGRFDRAFAGFTAPMPRSHFHDSFEYYGANWTPDFFAQFQRRRGYDLRTQLPALFGDDPDGQAIARARCDYRQTIAELHLAYIQKWSQWAHAHGSLVRNQAHGAPGNLIDLYAAADIPETEIFGSPSDGVLDERNIPMLKFASSAAHLAGRTLCSSESFTWFGEHFQVSLADLKPAADFLFLSGVNHIFFHGIPYSPADVPWPGWLFYAAVNFGPEGGLWHDLPAFTAYIARCQSILQSGEPDSDVLLYWPVFDTWQPRDASRPPTAAGMLIPFTVHDQQKWLWPTSFHETAMQLWRRGYSFDEVSDDLLAKAQCAGGRVRLGTVAHTYQAIVVPQCRVMPVQTLQKLVTLAQAGATVIVEGELPSDVPGNADRPRRMGELGELKNQAKALRGRFIIGTSDSLEQMLSGAGIPREAMVDLGLRCIRRGREGGKDYFIVNRGTQRVDGWVPLSTDARGAAILDPLDPACAGAAVLRHENGAQGPVQIYLQLDRGQSCIVRTFTDADVLAGSMPWRYWESSGVRTQTIDGVWRVHFIEGGPALPSDFETRSLGSWTARDDPEAKRFAGTARYSIEFSFPATDGLPEHGEWLLDLGRVCESARVRINGQEIATLWCAPFQVGVGKFLRPGRNVLEVDVTNLAANRIADLDRRGVQWKSFHEINFVGKDYKPFDASGWPVRDSGLLGPVRLVPMRPIDPAGEPASVPAERQ